MERFGDLIALYIIAPKNNDIVYIYFYIILIYL